MTTTPTTTDTGGPAFPTDSENQCAAHVMHFEGMTLLDYFAGIALHAEFSTDGANRDAAEALVKAAEKAGQTPSERMAFLSYEIASEMIAEKRRRESSSC